MNSNSERLIKAAGQSFAIDKEGYLEHLDDWNKEVAFALADSIAITLDDRHWEIIVAIRSFYTQYQHSPAMRPLVKYIKKTVSEDKGTSIYLMSLFPGSPAKHCAKIAGLPRPANCL